MSKAPRILVTGAGGPGAVNLTRSLKAAPEPVFVAGTDASPWYIHLALTDEKILVPRCSETGAYMSAIVEVCEKHEIDLVMPNSSLEMMVLSKYRKRLPASMKVPSVQAQEISASKWLTWKRWNSSDVPVPRTMLIDDREDVIRAFDTLGSNPIWFRGAGIPGRGVGGAALPCKKPEEAFGWIEFYSGWGSFMASEFLPGENLTFLGVFDHGRLIASQGRRRDAYVIPHVTPSGITGAPAVSHTVHREDINRLGPECVKAIDADFDGVAFVDFKCDSTGAPRPTEINAGRFGTTNHFYTAAGFNFPWLLATLALDRKIPDLPAIFNVLPANLYWIRTLDAGPVLMRMVDNNLVCWSPDTNCP